MVLSVITYEILSFRGPGLDPVCYSIDINKRSCIQTEKIPLLLHNHNNMHFVLHNLFKSLPSLTPSALPHNALFPFSNRYSKTIRYGFFLFTQQQSYGHFFKNIFYQQIKLQNYVNSKFYKFTKCRSPCLVI